MSVVTAATTAPAGDAPGSGVVGPPAGTATTPARVRVSTRLVAVGAVAALTLEMPLVDAFTTAVIVPLALTPVWWSATRRFVGARTLLALTGLALVTGLWLSASTSATHTVDPTLLRAHVLLMLGGVAGIGLLLWARTVVPVRVVALSAAAGLVMRLALEPINPANPWKYNFSYALTVLALALVVRRRPRPAEIALLLVIAAVSMLNDSRSAFATLVLAALLVLWQLRPRTLGRRASAITTLAFFGAVTACVYSVGTNLILEGYLGEETQQRSIAQVEASGSLLLGGRPEWGASVALFTEQPAGYGIGVVANLDDILVAKSGMAALNYDPNNGYVENYMFGGEIKLHSVLADLWSRHGPVGLVLAGWMLGLAVWSLASAVARRVATGLVIYLTCLMLWNFAFGPIYSAMPILVLAFGMLLLPRRGVDAGHATLDERPA
ncbi:O-antigen ligase family protein [Cellulomonas sp. SLBN-39]|uniref:O-antigen ligase family protein n=1 Tax=Cellulomonas sp. SLBN-39 TaxID=2768446 RepID=UPI00114D6EA8|nr:O-antigen ligase family protein [Cellulomonas sp. SLBN-39]TQL01429.1 hypothetical protein FBY24_0479 [Cellulomonas sp. SLBN-39]